MAERYREETSEDAHKFTLEDVEIENQEIDDNDSIVEDDDDILLESLAMDDDDLEEEEND